MSKRRLSPPVSAHSDDSESDDQEHGKSLVPEFFGLSEDFLCAFLPELKAEVFKFLEPVDILCLSMTNYDYYDAYGDRVRGSSLRTNIGRSIGENDYRNLLDYFATELGWSIDLQAVFLGALRCNRLDLLDQFSLESSADEKIVAHSGLPGSPNSRASIGTVLTYAGRSSSPCNKVDISTTVGELGDYFRFNHCRKYFNEGLEPFLIIAGAASQGHTEFARYCLKSLPASTEFSMDNLALICRRALANGHLAFVQWFFVAVPSAAVLLQSPLKVLELLVSAHRSILLDLANFLEARNVEVSRKFLYAIARDCCYDEVLVALEKQYGLLASMPPLCLAQVESMVLKKKVDMLTYILERTPHSAELLDQFFIGLVNIFAKRDSPLSSEDFRKVARCLFNQGYRPRDDRVQSLLTEKFLADSKLAILILSNSPVSEATMVKLSMKIQETDSTFADFIRAKAVT